MIASEGEVVRIIRTAVERVDRSLSSRCGAEGCLLRLLGCRITGGSAGNSGSGYFLNGICTEVGIPSAVEFAAFCIYLNFI